MRVRNDGVEQSCVRHGRIAQDNFAAMWSVAQCRNQELIVRGVSDWYTAGVITTCMWLVDARSTPNGGRPYPVRSPCTDRQLRASEETIEAEYQAAELMAERQPWLLEQRPGWCEGIRATLRWAWRNEGPPPLDENGEPTAWSAPRT